MRQGSGIGGWRRIIVLAVGLVVLVSACGGGDEDPAPDDHSPQTSLAWGDHAPEFVLRASDNARVRLQDYVSEQALLLYFHRGGDCDSCWQQIADLEAHAPFQALDVQLLSLTPDRTSELTAIKARYGIETPLLVDRDAETAAAYDVLQWGADGRPGFTFVLIEQFGHIVWVQDYGAEAHGAQFYVPVDELTARVSQRLAYEVH